jgi:16S rRNA (guanine(1405)-N(7))-methyltransferase
MPALDKLDRAEAMVTALGQSKKYRDTLPETIRALVREELARHRTPKEAEKAVRKRLHNIMAPYLGDPDYAAEQASLEQAFAGGDDGQIRQVCLHILKSHESTEERLPILDRFYAEIFAVTGKPGSILDIACGLNPLAFRWMGLPTTTQFYAYDILTPRIDLINTYFRLEGLSPSARLADVAVQFPQEEADMALFLKELPRFEHNYGKLGLPLLEALKVKTLVVSFPAISLHGGRSLVEMYRRYFGEMIAGKGWRVVELLFDSELVFCVEK